MTNKALPRVEHADAEWRALLSREDYEVSLRQGTERAFTGRYRDNHESGRYLCVGCATPLFDLQADSATASIPCR